MIIDTSAIVAIALKEPAHRPFLQAMADAPARRISGGTWIELSVVVVRRGIIQPAWIDRLIDEYALVIEPVTAEQSHIGHAAYRTYGRGVGHPARLNFGDCFAYALAKATGEPLLFKGDDFGHTDVVAAIGS